ncbi:IS4 family transposase [Methylicorpusculum oleiharenae]|nr:IS4 family transposase [Methylicorpusculum oleiharenae]
MAAHRTHDKAFTRQRVLTFPVLVSFLLCAFKGSLQTLLDDLFSTLDGSSLRTVSKSAVSQARQKLKASVFEALNDSLVGLLNELLPEPRWQGLQRVATDSTTLRLPPWLENQTEFGVQIDTGGQPYVLARALGLFATTSKLMIKTVVGRFDDAERALLAQLLPHLTSDDLLIMDRGFPALWLFTLLHQRGLPFLARMDGNQWPAVENFLRSGLTETVISLPVSAHARRQARAAGQLLTHKLLRLRLIKVILSTGHIEVLATSLTDTQVYPAHAFGELYHARWNIEEAFKVLKHRLYLEQFTGELPESIRQDIHAKIFTANLAEALAREAYESLSDEKAAYYYPNVTYILNSLKTRLFGWLIQRVPHDKVLELIALYAKTLERKRPGRKAPRPKNRLSPKPRRQYR